MADKDIDDTGGSGRRVATPEGSKFYGKPVGTLITANDEQEAEGRNRPVTMLRLRSLQRQYIAATRTKNSPLQAAVNKQFKQEMKIYRDVTGESASDVLDSLDADYEEGLKDSTEINDTDTADGDKPSQVSEGGVNSSGIPSATA